MGQGSAVDVMLAEYRELHEEKRYFQESMTRGVVATATAVIAVITAAGIVGDVAPLVVLPTIVVLGSLFIVLALANLKRLVQ
jgi:hypothetical protein